MAKRAIINIVEKYINAVSEKYLVERIFLFGSFAKKGGEEHSDIDIAFVFPAIPDYFKLQVDLMRLRRKIDLRIEPHLFSDNDFNENDPLVAEIMNTGIELSPRGKRVQKV